MAIKKSKKKKSIKSTQDRLRLSVFRSNTNIFAQVIDDQSGQTIASASSLKIKGKSKTEAAEEVGRAVALASLEKKVSMVVFDRGSYIYTGRIRALAESARAAGLKF